jgi:ornithine cyclodeaminase
MALSDVRMIDAGEVTRLSPYPQLIEAIAGAFRNSPIVPERNHYEIDAKSGATLLSMPSWDASDYIGQKLVTIMPDNMQDDLETIQGMYVLMSAKTGVPLAIMDAPELTARRTAAASALAAKYLVREGAETLLIVGTGKLASYLIEAHKSVRNYKKILVWGRDPDKAAMTCNEMQVRGLSVQVAGALESAVREADVVSCATTSTMPLVYGNWLKEGAHLDLVGAFKPSMRECDDSAVAKSTVFVDTFKGVMAAGGDIIQAIKAGAIDQSEISADLKALVACEHPGRTSREENTLFKSVGTAIEDYAIARLVYQSIP